MQSNSTSHAETKLAAAYRGEQVGSWEALASRWRRLGAPRASPFQQEAWLAHWYAAATLDHSLTPLCVAMVDTRTGHDAVLLPLVRRSHSGFSMVEFADLGLTDCNAPAIGQGAPVTAAEAAEFWMALRRAIPGTDYVRLAKMPVVIGDRPNPLALVACTRPSPFRSWSTDAPGSWDDFVGSLGRGARKAHKRSHRLFEEAGAARFLRAETPADGTRILDALDRLQRAHLDAVRARHRFDCPQWRAFYGRLATFGPAESLCMLTALELDGEIVAGLLAVLDKPRITLLRMAYASGPLARLGLGRLLTDLTLEAAHAQGYTCFDFSIGDGEHKRRFRTTAAPLVELAVPLTWLGHVYAGARNAQTLTTQVLERLRRRSAAPAPESPAPTLTEPNERH